MHRTELVIAERRFVPDAQLAAEVPGMDQIEATAGLGGALRWLEGRAVPYGQWATIGWFRELMEPGTFTKSVGEAARGLPLMLFHNGRSFPIGVADHWREEATGLYGRWRLDPDDEIGQQAARKARDGFLNGLSIGFQPIRSRWSLDAAADEDPDAPGVNVVRTEARLLETSMVPVPAYAAAGITQVRGRQITRTELPAQRGPAPRVAEWRAWRESLTS